MNKKRIFAVIVVISIIFTALFGFVIQERGKPKHGYKVPCEVSPTFAASSGEWIGVLIDNDITYTDGAHNIVPYDIDGDGKIELIANSYRSDSLIFYKYNGNPHNTSNWTRYVIDPNVVKEKPTGVAEVIKSVIRRLLKRFISGAHYVEIADINGDGRDDLIVAADAQDEDIVAYLAPENRSNTSAWRRHTLYDDGNPGRRCYQICAGDIDGDGDVDIVFSTKTDHDIGWLKNNGSADNWQRIWITQSLDIVAGLGVADFNNDGRTDIISSSHAIDVSNASAILFQHGGLPNITSNWTQTVIQAGTSGSIWIIDMDGDGDGDGNKDVLITGTSDNVSWDTIYLLENPYPLSIETTWNKYKINMPSFDVDGRQVRGGDIDEDGDMDIVVADQDGDRVIWFENNGTTFYENWEEHIVDQSSTYLGWCHAVGFGDIDGDGDLDIAVAAAGSNIFLYYYR